MAKYDCGGYATKVGLRCSDGRVIMKDAFLGNDGGTVPVVWNHQRNDPTNVLGHALLENRKDGVYAYVSFNNTKRAQHAKELVEHGDINAFSIYANKLKQRGNEVTHGVIREVSLVYAGANPGALIDNLTIEHSDGTIEELDDEVLMYFDQRIDTEIEHFDDDDKEDDDVKDDRIRHADDEEEEQDGGAMMKDIWDSMNQDQKDFVYAVVGHALANKDAGSDDEEEAEQSDEDEDDDTIEHDDEEGEDDMKKNVFDTYGKDTDDKSGTLTHADAASIFETARKNHMSLREATKDYLSELQHGIEEIETLFPEAKAVSPTPEMIMRQQDWVPKVWNATKKSPFSRIKCQFADITKDEARARGYIKGKKKIEEQFGLLKRTTSPQTVYKLQKLDRDDIIDITDFDVVAWIKAEMRLMLNEELARAIIVGDGRQPGDESKISEDHIHSVYHEDEFYALHRNVGLTAEDDTYAKKADKIIDTIYAALEDYKGSGSLVLYLPTSTLTTFLLARNQIGERMYKTVPEVATALRVSSIVEVPVMAKQTRTTDNNDQPAGYEKQTKYDLLGIMVNLSDYTVGADRGGAVTLFDDFDLDFNKYEYLIETRCSGALTKPASAIVLETKSENP